MSVCLSVCFVMLCHVIGWGEHASWLVINTFPHVNIFQCFESGIYVKTYRSISLHLQQLWMALVIVFVHVCDALVHVCNTQDKLGYSTYVDVWRMFY